ncbi:MAG: hypothetical protein FJ363_03760 [Gemmatimonadetes bacterium]|nr:hypothetical protein [Gemmatimonadota bacterium]
MRLDWPGVAGDSTAPRDVRAYVVFRRLSGASAWTAIASRPARRATAYRYQDFDLSVTAGTYQYGVAARDCGGLSSVRTGTTTVTLP